jgi:hypothetical protein
MDATSKIQKAENVLTPQQALQASLDSMSPKDRLEFLDLHAHSIKEEGYRAPLSDEELDEMKTVVTRLAIQIQELEDQKQAFMDELKLKMRPVEESYESVVREVRTQERIGFGKVWYMADTDSKTTFKVTEGNLIVGSRPSHKEELEKRLFIG